MRFWPSQINSLKFSVFAHALEEKRSIKNDQNFKQIGGIWIIYPWGWPITKSCAVFPAQTDPPQIFGMLFPLGLFSYSYEK